MNLSNKKIGPREPLSSWFLTRLYAYLPSRLVKMLKAMKQVYVFFTGDENEGADQTAETKSRFLVSRPKGLNGSSEYKSHHYQDIHCM